MTDSKTTPATMVSKPQLFFACPHCGADDQHSVTHFLSDKTTHSFGPWQCDAWFTAYGIQPRSPYLLPASKSSRSRLRDISCFASLHRKLKSRSGLSSKTTFTPVMAFVHLRKRWRASATGSMSIHVRPTSSPSKRSSKGMGRVMLMTRTASSSSLLGHRDHLTYRMERTRIGASSSRS